MDHATLSALATGAIFFALGVLIDRLFQRRLRQTLAARDNTIDAHEKRLVRLYDRLAELAPDAAIGRKHREQREAALATAQAANAARNAAKASGNVTPITPGIAARSPIDNEEK